MIIAEVYDLLTLIASVDNRRFDDATVAAWHAILGDLPLPDAQAAAIEHFRSGSEYLMPAHVRAGALAIARERCRIERDTEAAEKEAIEAADRGPLTDRSPEIRAFVDQVRSVLPPGDPDKLRYATKQWKRVRRVQEAVENSEFAGWRAVLDAAVAAAEDPKP